MTSVTAGEDTAGEDTAGEDVKIKGKNSRADKIVSNSVHVLCDNHILEMNLGKVLFNPFCG